MFSSTNCEPPKPKLAKLTPHLLVVENKPHKVHKVYPGVKKTSTRKAAANDTATSANPGGTIAPAAGPAEVALKVAAPARDSDDETSSAVTSLVTEKMEPENVVDKETPEISTPSTSAVANTVNTDELKKLIADTLGAQLGSLIDTITNTVEAKLTPSAPQKKPIVARKKMKPSFDTGMKTSSKTNLKKPITARHVKQIKREQPSTTSKTRPVKKTAENGQVSVFVHSNTKRMEYPPNEYPIEDMHKAVLATFSKEYTLNAAAKLFNVPRSTLCKKMQIVQELGYVPNAEDLNNARGPKPQFSDAAENGLKDFMYAMMDRGFTATEDSMRESIVDIATELGETEDLRKPSKTWRFRFANRHPGLKEALIKNKRENSDAAIQAWYRNLWNGLKSMGQESLLSQPDRVFTIEEIALPITEEKIYRKNECKWFYCTDKDAVRHSCICFNAAGAVTPLFLAFPESRQPACVVRGVWPAVAPVGWFTANTRFEHLEMLKMYLIENNLLNPDDDSQKVLLLLDGHASAITYKYFKYCESAGIIVWSLLPKYKNTKLPADQPVDIIREAWPQAQSRHYLNPKSLSPLQFSSVCKEAFDKLAKAPAVIRKSFRDCGIVPFDFAQAAIAQEFPSSFGVLYEESEEGEQMPTSDIQTVDEQALVGGFQFFSSFLPAKQIKEFEKGKGSGKLYRIWRDWQTLVNKHLANQGTSFP